MSIQTLCKEYKENKRMIEELENMNDSIKAKIIAAMDNMPTITDGEYKITYKDVTSNKFNTTAFKKAYNDLYLQYISPITYKKFTIS